MNIKTEYLAGYHIAEVDFPIPSMVAEDTWGISWYPDVDSWCEQTFGTQDIWGDDPVNGWKRMRNKYFFTDESKRKWFILRWA